MLIVIDLDKFTSVTVDDLCFGGVSQEYYGGPAVCIFSWWASSLLFLWCVWAETEETVEH